MDSIKLLIPKNLKRIGVAKRVTASIIVEAANQVLAEVFGDLAGDLQATSIKNGTLSVLCKNSSMAQEIIFYEAEILTKLNFKLGTNTIKQVRASL